MVQHGAHKPAVQSVFGVLQKAKNEVATAFGISSSHCGGHKREPLHQPPIQGVRRGNGAGPISIVDMSSTGIALMAIRGFGAILQACLSLAVLVVVCFMFVDNDQIQQTAIHPNQPAEEVVPTSQEGLDCWVRFLGS